MANHLNPVNQFKSFPRVFIPLQSLKLLLCACAVVLATFQARALTFNVTYDSSITSLTNAAQVESAFNVAAQTFQNLFTNAITLNLTVAFGNVGLGQSSFSLYGYTYAQVTNALSSSRTTSEDTNAIRTLPAVDPTGSDNWYIPFAQVKALKIPDLGANSTENDGTITFSSSQPYTFDPTNRTVSGKYDFIAVAEHEISEVMGRCYGLGSIGGGYVPYDLFRFTNSGVRNFSTNSGNIYFSINNGTNSVKTFNPGSNGGDPQDWASSSTPDACDAFLSSGHIAPLSAADLIALDIMGYNLNLPPAPKVAVAKVLNGFQLTFTNTSYGVYTVLASTNLTTPTTNWTVLGHPIESPSGHYQFTDTTAGTIRFYRIRCP